MKIIFAAVLIISSMVTGVCAAQGKPAPMSDKDRIDSLIRQNQVLLEENTKLKEQGGKPKTKEEAFAICMQAAKGEKSAMAVESIGGHCSQLLKK